MDAVIDWLSNTYDAVFHKAYAPPLALIPALSTGAGLAEYLAYVVERGEESSRKETKEAAKRLRTLDFLAHTVAA